MSGGGDGIEGSGRGALIPSRRRRGSAGRCARSDGNERERPGRLYRERRRRTELGGLAGWEWAEAQEEPWGCGLFYMFCFLFIVSVFQLSFLLFTYF